MTALAALSDTPPPYRDLLANDEPHALSTHPTTADGATSTDRTMLRIGCAAGIGLPVTLLARSAPYRTATVSAVAMSSVAALLVLACLGYLTGRLAGRSAAGLHHARYSVMQIARRAGVAIGCLWGVAILWSVATRTPLFDPTGLGYIAPHGSPPWQVAPVGLVAFLAGMTLPGLRRIGHVEVSGVIGRRPLLASALASVTAVVLTITARSHPAVSLLVSLAVTTIVLVVCSAVSRARPDGPVNHLAGVALGLVICSHGSVELIARRYVERVDRTGGVTHLAGPLVPAMIWAALLSVSVGLVVVTVVAAAIGSRRTPLTPPRSAVLFAPAVIAAGLLLRVGALFTILTARRDGGDPFFYHVTANLLARGRGFQEPLTWIATGHSLPSALHGPAFPAVLSFVSRLGGTSYVDHQLASAVLGLPQIIAVIALARLIGGRRVALIAGLFAVLYPNMWVTDGSLFVEGMMAAFTTAATWCAYRWMQQPRLRTIAWLGAWIGLAALTRGEAVLLIPLLLGVVVLRHRKLALSQRFRHAAIGGLLCIAVLSPWMIYNAPRFNVFVPLSTNSNEVLFYANCDDVYSGNAIGFWSFACQVRYRQQFGDAPGDQAEQSVFWRHLAFEYAKDHRSQLPKVIAARVGRQWELFRPQQTVDFAFIEGRNRRAVQFGQYAYYVMMVLAVIATVSLRRRKVAVWPLWCHAVAVTLTAAYAYGTLRFRAPFEPILCVLAAFGTVACWQALAARRGHPSAAFDPVAG
jgi:4-amino-4-deoxy-L-arabinose transferase-like glycosyltransferase